MSKKTTKFASSGLAVLLLMGAGSVAAATINFNFSGLNENSYVSDVTVGGVTMSVTGTQSSTGSGSNVARIYDTKAGHTTDPDLNYGSSGFTNLNTGITGVDLGNVLIIDENGLGTTSDDNQNGGKFSLSFSQPLSLESLDVVDSDSGKVTIKLFDANDNLLGSFSNLLNGDTNRPVNLFETIRLSGMSPVTKLEVVSTTSFAIDNIKGSAVPIPAAVWLFGSALLGLAGVGYRRRPSAI
ncbi:VPLPA-CTERM sorting domain-containing protein [Thiorhodococcus mannitoliphagus]|uniref:VPLPA-CTERM sorting domain-containing protein n=1 Tax=Thiorhodococcus mannitoliphagus TaxID=329406 RepID=UPI001980285A|nr:VPLPA-CTERM sorting domain-containing protein [Thiorhodococcus mannitoliphagus]